MNDTVRAPILAARQDAPHDTGRPLVVDLDGSLVHTDTLLEGVLALTNHPLRLLRALAALRHGKPRLKAELAAAADLDAARLPYNQLLLSYLREQHESGRFLVLATGADRKTAQAVADHLDLFDLVLASDGRTNLTGPAKLAAIRNALGGVPFTYVGNSRTDLAVWRGAQSGICVNARPGVARAAARVTRIERSFPSEAAWLEALFRRLRPHQ